MRGNLCDLDTCLLEFLDEAPIATVPWTGQKRSSEVGSIPEGQLYQAMRVGLWD